MSKFINIVGNPITGFKCFGTFDSEQEASDWQDGCDESCWVAELEPLSTDITYENLNQAE